MHFRVTIPEHVKSGQTIRISCPDGTEANVKVPKGLKTGDSFIFEISTDQLNDPKSLMESIKKKKDTTKKGFMESDIRNLQDFLVASIFGLFIGFGIIMGFVFGILVITRNYAEPVGSLAMPSLPRGDVSHEEARQAIDSMHKKLKSHIKQQVTINNAAKAAENNKPEIPKTPFFEKGSKAKK